MFRTATCSLMAERYAVTVRLAMAGAARAAAVNSERVKFKEQSKVRKRRAMAFDGNWQDGYRGGCDVVDGFICGKD